MNDRARNDNGLSDALGAVVLVAVVAMGITIAGMAILSSPVPDRVPALNAEVTNTSDTIFIRHTGGDTLARGEYRILADGIDRTDQFLSGSTVPAQWSVGDTLEYSIPTGIPMPASIQIVAVTGKGESVILQVQVRPPTLRPTPTISPSGTTTTTTTTATPSPTTSTTTTTPTFPPVADFSGTPTSGTAPLNVVFTDASTNSPTSWSWNFGDSGTSTSRNPTHQYLAAGTYTVTLTATNTGGSNTVTKANYITVTNPAPTVISITPNTDVRGNNTPISNLAGTNFQSGATVTFSTGKYTVTATNVVFVSSSKITCIFPIPNQGWAEGDWDVSVINPDAQSGTLTAGFHVTKK